LATHLLRLQQAKGLSIREQQQMFPTRNVQHPKCQDSGADKTIQCTSATIEKASLLPSISANY
jgi:hypothetical protein